MTLDARGRQGVDFNCLVSGPLLDRGSLRKPAPRLASRATESLGPVRQPEAGSEMKVDDRVFGMADFWRICRRRPRSGRAAGSLD